MSKLATNDRQRLQALTPLDRDYWLGHCDGFRVDSGGGRVGFVEEVRGDGDPDVPTILAVRAGMLGRRLLLFTADDVDFIVPRARRVWLRSSAGISGTETLIA